MIQDKTIKHVIGITGPKRSGKDTSASYIHDMFGYEVLSFAEPMKNILCTTFGITLETLDYIKNNTDVCTVDCMEYIGEDLTGQADYHTKFSTDMRKILQRFGTDAMKKYFGEDVWANKLVHSALHWDMDTVVISDLRYMNEYQCLKEYAENLTIIRLHKDDTEGDNHSSEQEYKQIPSDYDISNNGTVQELYNKLNKILAETTKDLE